MSVFALRSLYLLLLSMGEALHSNVLFLLNFIRPAQKVHYTVLKHLRQSRLIIIHYALLLLFSYPEPQQDLYLVSYNSD